ncbi:mediator of RNA polymerase II transcription subunit 20-like [Saccoglossus kowalevskii]|uniref:Mediator of RNA polymerase II transcription subunit 20 n=1 Tax=Saccoglossus kowalevskii TaxID=10224 RepID=A0ABM0H1V5_SACKO|nr:PREDICTED: mediator of RNA polymerase II transcription subunit 20-like [Saccoglossus kowalevskii]
MGVTCVCQWPVPDNKSVQQVVDMIAKRVELLGSNKSGTFCVDCETYQSSPMMMLQKTVHIIHNSEQPMTSYAVMEGPGSAANCLVADTMFDQIMQRLKGFYMPKKTPKVESKGQHYELGDFNVKIGTVTLGGHAKGILLEIEYTPCVVVLDCWNLLTEFMQGFMASHTPSLPSYLANRQDANYTPMDTIMQYLDHFNTFTGRKVVQQPAR